ncbi:MAG: hypothetical protein ACR2L1_00325 [Pyrinomonadaceae bacterium]
MKSILIKIFVGLLTFSLGVIFFWFCSSKKEQPNQNKAEKNQRLIIKNVFPTFAEPQIEHSNLSDEIEKIPLNPYKLHKFINDNQGIDTDKLWKRLGINSQLNMVYSHIGIEFDNDYESKFDGISQCREAEGNNLTQLVKLQIDNDKVPEVMLKVCSEEKVRFLVFKRKGNSWSFLGSADHDFSRYYEPIPSVRKLDGRRFLVLKCQGISGTGVSLSYERWFEVKKKLRFK